MSVNHGPVGVGIEVMTYAADNVTIYTSLEPCSQRASRPVDLPRAHHPTGDPRIEFAWSEPDTFVVGAGADVLRAVGRTIVHRDDLAEAAQRPNLHLFGVA